MVVIDGTNVAYSRKLYGKPMIENIKLILELFEPYTPVDILVKSSLIKNIDKKHELDRMINKGVIIQVPPTFDDDKLILRLAYENDDYIVSNDKFRDHKEFPSGWIKDHRIEYVIIRGRVYISPDLHGLPFVNLIIDKIPTKLPISEDKKCLN